jgi:hypothetical protein
MCGGLNRSNSFVHIIQNPQGTNGTGTSLNASSVLSLARKYGVGIKHTVSYLRANDKTPKSIKVRLQWRDFALSLHV